MAAEPALPRQVDAPGRRVGSCIVWPSALRDDDLIGGKAAGLLGLVRGGLPVPDWFVALPSAFASVARPTTAPRPRAASRSPGLDDSVLRDLQEALRTLCPHGERVAVRSSAADEDGGARSYAGQCETLLGVRPEEVPAALVRVWCSGFAARISAYRIRAGLEEPAAGPAVIVQRQVDARVSGVAFSADPVTGRRGLAIISAVAGMGESLVSGQTGADTWTVDREERVSALRRSESAPPVLDDAEVRRVARLARLAEHVFRRPQDIEWAFEEDRLLCLQSRPVTTLGGVPDPDAPPAVWDCRNISENYGGVTTPLTFSFVRCVYASAYRESARAAGVVARTIAARERAFAGMIGIVEGRIYYDLSQWQDLMHLLPGSAWNWPFLAHMLGIPETMPCPAAVRRGGNRWRDVVSMTRVAVRIGWRSARLGRDITRFQTTMDGEIRDLGTGLEELRPDELAARYRRLTLCISEVASVPTLNDFWVMVLAGASRRLAGRWIGDAAAPLCAALLALRGDSITSSIGRSLASLALAARHDAVLLDVLAQEPAWSLERLSVAFPGFAAAAARHVALYGVRVPGELKLETRTLDEDPAPLFNAIVRLAGMASTSDPPTETARSAAAGPPRTGGGLDSDGLLREALGGRGVRVAVQGWLLARARGRLLDREALRFTRARIFAVARGILMGLGERFWALGLLDNPRDILFLQVEEALAFVEGQAVTTDLRGLAAFRKAEFDLLRTHPDPPVRFETRGSPYLAHALAKTTPPASEQGESRSGLACSPGRVTGRVRLVEPPMATGFEPGDVVVAPRTDPGWVTLLPASGALVVEVGNPLSHAAIIARELGLPMVAALPGLMDWLRDGDIVEIDGSAGTVIRLPAR